MSPSPTDRIPGDYPRRIKSIRGLRGLTQAQFAELVGVSFASVNRWENGQSRPNSLAWRRVAELENQPADGADQPSADEGPNRTPGMDFSADPEAVSAVAEAHRLASGHLFNPAFATETSLIDPLPHQRIAVYQRMLQQSPLRFLLADDAGAGKTIMTGLYVREMLSRRLLRRVLVVPPAGLVGNWEREMRTLFRLPFRIVGGAEARAGNPFLGPESDLVIVSVDTLAGERMFGHLKDPQTDPFDLVVFDEAHKLSADRQPDFRVRKTSRYKLAEALAGAESDDKERWKLPWASQHLLLLTATPHMGKDHPYYYLWRLLLPDALSTFDAFEEFPPDSRQRHFIRRTKEEMVHYDHRPLYPQRNCDTLSYELSQGPDSEQELYDETTEYMRYHYNWAKALNRSAARLAMSVFQRRLASSTYALLRSFERRLEKLENLIDDIRSGRLSEEQLARRQQRLGRLDDIFETSTADEEAASEDGEQHEVFESLALEGTVAVTLAELETERTKVAELLDRAQTLFDAGEESKFEKLREVLAAPHYRDQKLIIFTEHRDTAEFLVRRLEGLGYTGRVALIHGGLAYPERERQVELFRRPADQGGATYLVATDAAGEGINLQFCWLMVNYDIPWNPARLEQRMGRIHRYGQKHDPVVIVNLVSAGTREGKVLKTLLDKLEAIRRQLSSDKVFDVVGRLFEGLSVRDYLEQAVVGEGGAEVAARQLEGNLTEEQVRALEERERALYGDGGEVRNRLDDLNEEMEKENYRRLLPGYVRRFVEKSAPLLDLRLEGDPGGAFNLVPDRPRAADPLLPSLEAYPEEARGRLTVYKPEDPEESIWLHPGEPVFDTLSAAVRERLGAEGLRGGVFSDPYATEAYLFHIARVSARQQPPLDARGQADGEPQLVESRLVGLRQTSDGAVQECPVEHLLLLRGAGGISPGGVPLATLARGIAGEAADFLEEVSEQIVQAHRQRRLDDLPRRLESVSRGFDYQAAELAAARSSLREKAVSGDRQAAEELAKVRERQRSLNALRGRRLAELRSEPDLIRAGEAEFLVHALVVPSQDAGEAERYVADVEAIAMEVAAAYEKDRGARVQDVSKPELARRAGLPDWPGFDLLSGREGMEPRAIEVKGRADTEGVEMSGNEWAKACNLRERYWLYVVFDCATPRPRLVRVRDPFSKLLVGERESRAFTITAGAVMEAAE